MNDKHSPKSMRSRKWQVTDDPTKSMAIGDVFFTQFMNFKPVVPAGAGSLDRWDNFGSALFAIGFKTKDAFMIEGSGVLISPGIGLAARHVFQSHLTDLAKGNTVPYAISILPSCALMWEIHQLIMGDSDVSVLRLDLCSALPDDPLYLASLTTRTPLIGETVMFAGARSHEHLCLEHPQGIEVRVGVGEVTAVHPLARDKVILPSPCIEVKCLTIGGMSGGPVFDMHGKVLGILTSSIEHEEGPSYASLWWPSACLKIGTSWPPGFIELPTDLISLCKLGAISVEKIDSLDAHEGSGVSYRPWS